MATEILEGRGIIVRRPEREYLLAIRRGERDYDEILNEALEKMERIDEICELSNLPNKIDKDFVNSLLIKIRKEFYKL